MRDLASSDGSYLIEISSYFKQPKNNQSPNGFSLLQALICLFDIQLWMLGERVMQEQQKMVKKIKHYIYDPIEVVGSGFSSKVFKGLNQLTQETIAIKVLQLSKIQSEVEKYLLNNQINALRALNHPHVLRTVEILMTKNNVYIMTEFCEGGDLQQHVKKQGRLSDLQALHLARDITEGYLAIEDKLIVHRDLKTANIFLTPTGARIADFGFCQFLNETKKPQLFYNVGSPAYMSPESYRENIYSAKSDIWSIGIILYEMLTGDTPDKNLTYSEMSNNLMAGRIAVQNEDIRHILSLCFKRDLKERIGAQQLLEMINTEIMKIEGSRGMRPPLGQPINTVNSVRLAASSSMHPLETLRNNNNRQMVSSTLPLDQGQPVALKGQSPLKARFNGIMARQQVGRNVEPSPVKFIERRFSKEQEIPPQARGLNRLKSATDLLLFIYRLLNSITEVNLQRTCTMRMILFRHRNFLQAQVERFAEEEHFDRVNFEPLRQFHFLKGKFDDAYLQRQAQFSSQSSPVSAKMQEMANIYFTDPRAIELYSVLTLEISFECESKLASSEEGDTNRIAVILDYLLLHFEILQLYSQGKPLEAIVQEHLQLPNLLKDQPKRITPFHLALLRHKLKLTHKYFDETGEEKQDLDDSPGYKQLNQIPQRKTLIVNGFF